MQSYKLCLSIPTSDPAEHLKLRGGLARHAENPEKVRGYFEEKYIRRQRKKAVDVKLEATPQKTEQRIRIFPLLKDRKPKMK